MKNLFVLLLLFKNWVCFDDSDSDLFIFLFFLNVRNAALEICKIFGKLIENEGQNLWIWTAKPFFFFFSRKIGYYRKDTER